MSSSQFGATACSIVRATQPTQPRNIGAENPERSRVCRVPARAGKPRNMEKFLDETLGADDCAREPATFER